MKYFLSPTSDLPGLLLLEDYVTTRFLAKDGMPVHFKQDSARNGFLICKETDAVTIQYHQPAHAYRALGLLLAGCVTEEKLEQTTPFQSLGVMLDLSRNGVLKVESIELLLRRFALAGINSVQLYIEDTYQLPDEPFFGYFRGAYSPEELRRIDDFAHAFGIEIIPCIQTLGHLEQILHWPAYESYKDVFGVLMVGEPEVYRLIEKMLRTLKECFRSNRIHIGMDEAHGVGTGNYLKKHGYRRPFDILSEHLEKVVALCEKFELKPMLWSDMFFRIGSEHNDYYDLQAVIPKEVANRIPAAADLVYWDYYHTEPEFYEEWIRRHRTLGKEPIFAAGAWGWTRFWSYWNHAQQTLSAGMTAARKEKLQEAFLTVWNDDGAECHPFSMMMVVQLFAEYAYVDQPDLKQLAQQFPVLSPVVELEGSILASDIDYVPAVKAKNSGLGNYSKWILWHDPIQGFLNCHITPDLPQHYQALAEKLEAMNKTHAQCLGFMTILAKTLALKTDLHLHARAAYKAKDAKTIRRLVAELIPNLLTCIQEAQKEHHAIWTRWNKPFGWESLNARYVQLYSRVQFLSDLLKTCVENSDTIIPELECEPHPLYEQDEIRHTAFQYASVVAPHAK